MPITFALLAVSIALVWLPPWHVGFKVAVPWWALAYAMALISGLHFGVLAGWAIAGLACLLAVCLVDARLERSRFGWAWGWVVGLVSLALALHLVPGFHNAVLVNGQHTSADAVPFTLYANFDKGSVALLLLALVVPRVRSIGEMRAAAKVTLQFASITAAVVVCAAWAVGYVRPHLKIPAFTAEFLVVNLLFTCIAEEAFFRGLIQERLTQVLASRPAMAVVPVVVSAALFGLAHAGAGPVFMCLAAMTGVGAAWVYARTRRVESAVVVHFAVNAIHFLLFTYPTLK